MGVIGPVMDYFNAESVKIVFFFFVHMKRESLFNVLFYKLSIFF